MSEASINNPETQGSKVEIERAAPDEAETICDIRDRAWLEAYPNEALGITREDILLNAQGQDGVFVPRRVAYMREQFASPSPDGQGTYVAKVDGLVCGYTELHVDERGRKCIGAMCVAPEAQGTGIGGKLMDHALSVLGKDQDIFLEVVSYNQNAVDFYRHYGFEPTDAVIPEEAGRPDYMTSLPLTEMAYRAE